MLTKATTKFIKSLQEKKYRIQEQCFVVEGAKNVQELVASNYEVVKVIGTHDYLMSFSQWDPNTEVIEVTATQLRGLGDFVTNESVLAVARVKNHEVPRIENDSVTLVLDDIRDPGNLGTILRTADWYGIQTIIASYSTVDFYNPKVINSSKGSFARINFACVDIPDFLQSQDIPIYGAFLNGENIHNVKFPSTAFLVIGNESTGISSAVERLVTKRITIPKYGQAESLNAGVATAIILDNIRR